MVVTVAGTLVGQRLGVVVHIHKLVDADLVVVHTDPKAETCPEVRCQEPTVHSFQTRGGRSERTDNEDASTLPGPDEVALGLEFLSAFQIELASE